MKLITLMENTSCRDDLACEHGLSLYIEAGERRILFDAGQTGAFADNAEKLGVDLAAVDVCILSHGHYDHGGGLARFLEINEHAPILLSRHAFEGHFHGPEKDIGLNKALISSNRLIFVDDATVIGAGAVLHTSLPCPHGIEPHGLQVADGDALLPEDFRHEIYLLLRDGGKRILISGCSHRGILNIAEHFAPDVLIGGFHLMKVTDEARLTDIGRALVQLPTVYYTGHCTGESQFTLLKTLLGERLHALSTGAAYDI